MTSYSNKSNAVRAAKNIENAKVVEIDGRWHVQVEETYTEKRLRIKATSYEMDKVPYCGVEQDADGEGHCPHCGIHASNGFATYEDICESSRSAAGQMKQEYICLGCGGEWGPFIIRRAKSTKPVKHNGNKIDKVRAQQNGVKRPSDNTACGRVWAHFDALLAAGTVPASADAKAYAAATATNVNNALCELSMWRKFNGLSKR